MLEFGFPISVNVIKTVIDDPIRLRLRIDIDAGDNTDTFNDALLRTAPLSANGFNRFSLGFRDHHIVKQEVSVEVKLYVVFHRLPQGTGRNPFLTQKTIELVMTPSVCMIRKVRLREVMETC